MIRTTLKHPFFTNDRGWVPVKELHPGDWILTASDNWIAVEEVYDTGDWELVYNVRVADHHTYFVGDDDWGWSAWAHNAVCVAVDRTDPRWNEREISGHKVYGTAQNTTGLTDDPHAAHVMAIVNQLAPMAPADTYFVLNRTWRTALGRHNVPIGTAGAEKQPDILIVQPLGNGKWKIHAVEVMSLHQTRAQMKARLDAAWATVLKHGGNIDKGTFEPVSQSDFPTIVW